MRPIRRQRKPTSLRREEVWNLNTSLALLIAKALRQLADGAAHPGNLTGEEWERQLRAAALDFERVAETDGDHVPYDGLEFLTVRWRDLWD